MADYLELLPRPPRSAVEAVLSELGYVEVDELSTPQTVAWILPDCDNPVVVLPRVDVIPRLVLLRTIKLAGIDLAAFLDRLTAIVDAQS